jgi:hypothetical protein
MSLNLKPRGGLTLSYSAGRKVSDDNYGSFDFHVSVSGEVGEDEKPVEVLKEFIDFSSDVLRIKVKQARQKKLEY